MLDRFDALGNMCVEFFHVSVKCTKCAHCCSGDWPTLARRCWQGRASTGCGQTLNVVILTLSWPEAKELLAVLDCSLPHHIGQLSAGNQLRDAREIAIHHAVLFHRRTQLADGRVRQLQWFGSF